MELESYRFDESDYPKKPAYHILLKSRLVLNICRNDLDEITAACRIGQNYSIKQPACGCGRYWNAKTEGYDIPLNSLKVIHDQTGNTYEIWHDNRLISRDAQFARWLVPRLKGRGFTDKPATKKLLTADYLWYLFFGMIYIGIMRVLITATKAKPYLEYLAYIGGIVVLGILFYFSLKPAKHKRIVYQKTDKAESDC